MPYVIDPVNKIITLPEAVGGTTTIDVEEIYDECKQWYLYPQNRRLTDFMFRTSGGDDLTPGISQGAYYQLQNQRDAGWRIRPFEADGNYYFTGNLVPRDATQDILIPTIGNFTVGIFGLQPITQSVAAILTQTQDSSYRGSVYIDQAAGSAGTSYDIGLPGNPVSNLTDAKTILARVGGNKMVFTDQLTLDQDVEGYEIIGNEAVLTDDLDVAGFSLDRSKVNGCYITGAQGGTVGFEAFKCGFTGMSGLAVSADRCWFFSNVTLKLGATNAWNDCRSGVPENAKPQISVGNNAGTLMVRGWIGGFDLLDSTHADFSCSLDFDVGRLAIQNSCTAGDTVIGGDVWKDLLGTGGMTITDRSTARTQMVEKVEGNYTLEQITRLIAAEAAAKIVQAVDGTYAIRDLADTRDRITGDDDVNGGRIINGLNVTDLAGTPSGNFFDSGFDGGFS